MATVHIVNDTLTDGSEAKSVAIKTDDGVVILPCTHTGAEGFANELVDLINNRTVDVAWHGPDLEAASGWIKG